MSDHTTYKILAAMTFLFTLLVDCSTVIFGRAQLGGKSPLGLAAFVVLTSLPFFALAAYFRRKALATADSADSR